MTVEICCSSLISLRNALAGGAHRIELCADLLSDGLTPGALLLEQACQESTVPIHVLVRPRAGNFVYTSDEWRQMEREIEFVRRFPVQGIVIGALDGQGGIPVKEMRSLRGLAEPLDVTFHRAFDRAANPLESLEILVDLGFDRVLTSGQRPTALEGLPLLLELKERSAGRMVVMPGGGVTPENCEAFFRHGFRDIHLSARNRAGGHGSEGLEPVADEAVVAGVVQAWSTLNGPA